MITHKQLIALTLCCSLMIEIQAGAAESPELEHNPFARPPSERSAPPRSIRGEQDGPTQTLELQATMVGTRDRLANVGGRVLRPGDEIQGYTLLKVYEDRAVFRRQGKQEVIFVKLDPEKDDE